MRHHLDFYICDNMHRERRRQHPKAIIEHGKLCRAQHHRAAYRKGWLTVRRHVLGAFVTKLFGKYAMSMLERTKITNREKLALHLLKCICIDRQDYEKAAEYRDMADRLPDEDG